MKKPIKVTLAGAAIVVAAAVPALAGSTGDDGPEDAGRDLPITGTALDKASDAALAYMGGGRVTGTEVGDEESYYEVEVTMDDGHQVDVQLDEEFKVVSSEADGTTADD